MRKGTGRSDNPDDISYSTEVDESTARDRAPRQRRRHAHGGHFCAAKVEAEAVSTYNGSLSLAELGGGILEPRAADVDIPF